MPKKITARTGPTPDAPNGYKYTPAPDWVAKACKARFFDGGPSATGIDPKRPGYYLYGIGNFWDGPSSVKDNGDGTLSYTNPYNGQTDTFGPDGNQIGPVT